MASHADQETLWVAGVVNSDLTKDPWRVAEVGEAVVGF